MRKKWQISAEKRFSGREYDPITRERDPETDTEHLAWIRTLPCAVRFLPLPGLTRCEFVIQAHHPLVLGTAVKTPDSRAVPLCLRHHQERHLLQGTFESWSNDEAKTLESGLADIYELLGRRRREQH